MRRLIVALLSAALACAAPARAADAVTAAVAARPPVGWLAGTQPSAPDGFRVRPFARGLSRPIALGVLPNGDVLVIEARTAPAGVPAHRLTLLRDADVDGAADSEDVLHEDVGTASSVLLRRDRLYVAGPGELRSWFFFVGQARLNGAERRLATLPVAAVAPTLVTDRTEARLYAVARGHAPVAIAWNGAPSTLPVTLDRPLAALAFQPDSNQAWYVATEGTEDVLKSTRPHATGAGHALGTAGTVRAMAFHRGNGLPSHHAGGLFVARAGELVAGTAGDFAVGFVPFAAGRPAGPAEPFAGGFADDQRLNGRPIALAIARDGALLVADDVGGTIWRFAAAP